MIKIVLALIGLIIVATGVICVYDARILTQKMFSFGDKNEATAGLKILGFLLSLLGTLIIYFNL